MELTHFDEKGNARMVDVSEKEVTSRQAIACGKIKVSQIVYDAIADKRIAKGDVLCLQRRYLIYTAAGV